METIENNMSPTLVGEILQHLINIKETNVTALAKKTGIPQPTVLKIIKGQTQNPGIYTMEKLAQGLEVSPAIFFGEQSPDDSNNYESLYSIVTRYKRDNPQSNSSNMTPLYNWKDVANSTEKLITKSGSTVQDWYSFPLKVPSENVYCVKVPLVPSSKEFRPGDIIFIDPEKRFENGSIVLIRNKYSISKEDELYDFFVPNGEDEFRYEITFKKIYYEDRSQPYLCSLNPALAEQKIPIRKYSKIIGVVIGKFSLY